MDMIQKAYKVAEKAHRGQKRWGGEPYIIHPVMVADMVTGESEECVALLHDVVEDTYVSVRDNL